jgi:hypothetical protein
MDLALAERVANAVLYEGYILYPYRPSSVKNQQRWNFGGIYPHAYSEAQKGTDAWTMQTECLVTGDSDTNLDIRVRFLQLQARIVGELDAPLSALPEMGEPPFNPVDALKVEDQWYQSWQESVERDIYANRVPLAELVEEGVGLPFRFYAIRTIEPIRDATGTIVAVLVRQQEAMRGAIEISAELVAEGVYKITVLILNQTEIDQDASLSRDDALLRAFVSTHTLLTIEGGEFFSLLEPPDEYQSLAALCRNVGTWPVLLGEHGERDMVLSSPIILYDYPQIAPESPGDLFDGTEIDEILTLRIMTLTDAEKDEVRGADERGRALLERTENMTAEQLMKLHGTMRNLR